MAGKLWDGRFTKGTDASVDAFNASLGVDARMYREDIAGSLAHARMLDARGLLPEGDLDQIEAGLAAIRDELDAGTLRPDPQAEDIHMMIEAELTRRIGDAGRRLHTGRSRNDQVALDVRLHLRAMAGQAVDALAGLMRVLLDQAERNLETVMPGYTHLQRAQPVTFAHHLMAYFQMFRRDIGRIRDAAGRMDDLPLGAGALAGTTLPLDREAVARDLGFSRISENSLDAVSDRDFALELASACAILMVHLSRLGEEIVLWSSQEFAFVELDDAYSTGSSIMPQKKNPDVAELVRGKSGRVIGDLVALLTLMKGLPLAYNKDMQEDKEAVFDAVDTVLQCLGPLAGLLATLAPRRERMREAAAGGFTNATDLADYLVRKGLPFREAHAVSGRLVRLCLETGTTLEALPLDTLRQHSPLFGEDVYEAISLDTCVAGRNLPGGPAPGAVAIQVARGRAFLDSLAD